MTQPAIFHFFTHMAGDGWDTRQYIWSMWWVKKAISDPNLSLYFTDYVYYPKGTSMAFYAYSLTNELLSVPFQFFLKLHVVWNLIFFFHFVFAGYAMFLFVDYLINDKRIAFLSGFAFTFCSFNMGHSLGHLNAMTIGFIPLYILFMIKTLREDKISNPILAGIFFALNGLSYWYYMIYTSIFSLFLFFYILFFEKIKINRSLIKKISIFIIVSFILIFPFAYPMLKELQHRSDLTTLIQDEFLSYNSYFTPSVFNHIWVIFFQKFFGIDTTEYLHPGIAESSVFLGFTVLTFSIIGMIYNFKKSFFWVASSSFFYILSLGRRTPIYMIFYKCFPFFSIARTPSKIAIIVLFLLLVPFSYGIKNIILKFNRKKYGYNFKFKIGILILILIGLMIDFFPIQGYWTADAYIPNFYKNIEEGNYTIYDIPPSHYNIYYQYYQTIHEKKILLGYVTHANPESEDFLWNAGTPFREFSTSEIYVNDSYLADFPYYKENGTLDLQISKISYENIKKLNIKYVIIHKQFLGQIIYFKNGSYPIYNPYKPFKVSKWFFENLQNSTKYYEDEDLLVFKIGE